MLKGHKQKKMAHRPVHCRGFVFRFYTNIPPTEVLNRRPAFCLSPHKNHLKEAPPRQMQHPEVAEKKSEDFSINLAQHRLAALKIEDLIALLKDQLIDLFDHPKSLP